MPEATIHLFTERHTKSTVFRSELFNKIVDLKPLQRINQVVNFTIDIWVLGPVASVRGPMEDQAQVFSQVTGFELTLIGYRDDGLSKFGRSSVTDCDVCIRALISVSR